MQPGSRASKLLLGFAVLGASLFALGAGSSASHAPPVDPSADFDADGIINALDNCCLVAANGDQRDTDRDGIGNTCDADFDNSGLVDLRDLLALLRAFDSGAADKDLNGDGVVNAKDLRIFVPLLLRRPGPRLDSDGDGVADLEDPCPMTAQGIASSLPGWSVLQLLQQPGALLGILSSNTLELTGQLRVAPEMLAVATELELAGDEIDVAAGSQPSRE